MKSPILNGPYIYIYIYKPDHTPIVLILFGINTYDLNHLKVDLGIICYIYALCNMLEALCGQSISFVLLPKKIINICN